LLYKPKKNFVPLGHGQFWPQGLYLNKFESSGPRDATIVRFGEAVLEKKIFQAFPYILLCKSLSPWGRSIHYLRGLIWTNLNLLAPRMLHAKYQGILASGSWEEDLSKFPLFYPLLGPKGASPFILTNLNPHLPRIFPKKFGWNWPRGSWEEVI